MHATKGQNQQLFIKLAPGNQLEASVRFLSSLSIQRVDISVLEENESINKCEAILYGFQIYHFLIFQDGVVDTFNKMFMVSNFSAHVMNMNVHLPCLYFDK